MDKRLDNVGEGTSNSQVSLRQRLRKSVNDDRRDLLPRLTNYRYRRTYSGCSGSF